MRPIESEQETFICDYCEEVRPLSDFDEFWHKEVHGKDVCKWCTDKRYTADVEGEEDE